MTLLCCVACGPNCHTHKAYSQNAHAVHKQCVKSLDRQTGDLDMVDVVIYESFKGVLDNGQQVLVQVFREDTNAQVISASIAQRSAALDLWLSPLPLRPV